MEDDGGEDDEVGAREVGVGFSLLCEDQDEISIDQVHEK